MYDGRTGTLSTADAFGYLFPKTADPYLGLRTRGRNRQRPLRQMTGLGSGMPPRDTGEASWRECRPQAGLHDVSVIARTHGNAVRGDLGQCRQRFTDVILEICR